MSSEHGRSAVLILDESRTRIQTIAELLLLSCSPKPVFTKPQDTQLTAEAYVQFRDKVMAQLNKVLLLTRDIATQVHGPQIQMRQLCSRVKEMSHAVISLSELCAHIAYLMAVTVGGAKPAVPGPVCAVHQLTAADLDLQFCCTRLKRSRMNDLQPNVLVDLCSSITKSITAMSEVCRLAADKVADSNDQDQFKLCVKTITSTTGCLVSSIKSFKHKPSEVHLSRVVTFCDPVTSASSALLAFATEDSFTGQAACLPQDGLDLYKSVIGLCMNMASAAVQICKAVRDLVYSSSTKRHRDRVSLCVESVTRSAGQLRDFLLTYQHGAPIQHCVVHHFPESPSSSTAAAAAHHHHNNGKSNKEKRHSSRHSAYYNNTKENTAVLPLLEPSSDSSTSIGSQSDAQLQTVAADGNVISIGLVGGISSDYHNNNSADDSGISCEERFPVASESEEAQLHHEPEGVANTVNNSCLLSPSSSSSLAMTPSSRPSSAVIDNMFLCEEKDGGSGVDVDDDHSRHSKTLSNSSFFSPSSSLSSLTGSVIEDEGSLLGRRFSLDLPSSSTDVVNKKEEFFLKPHDV